jgi:hypothetical protein
MANPTGRGGFKTGKSGNSRWSAAPARKRDARPVHRWNGTLRYLCKQATRKSAH